MRIRVGVGILVSAVALFALASSASACATASLTFSPSSAGPGDTVSFSISGIEPGATYSIELNGRTIASGTNQTNFNGVSGTFTMPDFGGEALTVTGFGKTFHAADNDSQDPSRSLEYVPPRPATQSPPPPPVASPPKQSPAPAETVEPLKRHTHPRPLPPLAVVKHEAKKQRRDSPATSPAVGAAPSDAVGSGFGPRQPRSGSGANDSSSRESSGVPSKVLDAVGGTTSVGPARVPTLGLLAIGLLLIAGLGLAGVVIYIFRNGPDPDAASRDPAPMGPDPIEAELQQIIAEEMGRQLVSDLNLGEPTQISLK